MRIGLLFLFIFTCPLVVSVQNVADAGKLSDNQWNTLFTALDRESWKDAFDLSSKYLDELKNDDKASSIENLRYILIYSAAGSVATRQLSYDELEKQLPKVVGKKIATPFHPLGINCRPTMFNYICKVNEGEYDVSITTTNKQATSILAFEYIKLAKKFDIPRHQEELASVIGTVDKIVTNPNRSTIVILRIFTKDAEIVLRSEVDSSRKIALASDQYERSKSKDH